MGGLRTVYEFGSKYIWGTESKPASKRPAPRPHWLVRERKGRWVTKYKGTHVCIVQISICLFYIYSRGKINYPEEGACIYACRVRLFATNQQLRTVFCIRNNCAFISICCAFINNVLIKAHNYALFISRLLDLLITVRKCVLL